MTTVLIVIAAVIVVAIVVLAMLTLQRRRHLKEQFGPEYDRLVDSTGGRRAAESELREREKRHDSLEIRPLDPGTRDRYATAWVRVQERFVDDPRCAVSEAGQLLTAVMTERGYPADEDDEQRIADLSVEHSRTLNRYRSAYQVSLRAGEDGASTEELRNAMVDYRALFQELLDVDGDLGTRVRTRPKVADRSDVSDDTERTESEVSALLDNRDRIQSEVEHRPDWSDRPERVSPDATEDAETVTDDETRRV